MTEQAPKTFESQFSISEISALLLATSIGIDWSYYKKLGLSFSEVPSSISDHFRSIIEWLPQLTLILLAFLLYDLFFKRIEKGVTLEDIKSNGPLSESLKFQEFLNDGRKSLLQWVVILGIPLPYILVGEQSFENPYCYLSLLTVIIIWSKFYEWVSAYPRFNSIYNFSTQKSIKFIFPFVLCSLLFGYISAVRDLYQLKIDNNQAHIILKGHDKGVKHLLRVLEKGIVGYDISQRKTAFYPWEHIEKISYNKTVLPFHGLLSLTEKNH